MEASPRAPVGGPPFIRLLARLTHTEVAQPGLSPSERLGEWLDWTRAVALSRALDGTPPADDGEVDAAAGSGEAADECARIRAGLAASITDSREPAGDGADFAPFQQHCQAIQRAMQAATGRLRGQLRERLARQSPEQARLAEVDAAMEAALSPREHALLAALPALLGRHFERLRQAARPGADEDTLPPATPGAWLDTFRRDMHGALLAELDLRFEPVEALLAALRTP